MTQTIEEQLKECQEVRYQAMLDYKFGAGSQQLGKSVFGAVQL